MYAADKKTIERFRNELKIARKIRHKNVCAMFDLGEEKGSHYITMDFIPGQDLKGLIRQTGRLAIPTAISIGKQVCEGLAEAHRLGVIHRDLKPSNIMIDKEGNARIMDFGIARTIKGKGITGPGVMIGTPEYMSPEQVEAKEVDQRSDIYSLGIIMYEMLTGRLPFEADTPFAVGVKQKSEMPKSPKEYNPQISDDLSKVILKCMEKESENRFQNVSEVRSELEKIEQGLPTTDRVIPKKKTLTSSEITVQFSMKKIFIPAFAVVALVVIGLIIWSPWSIKTSEPIPSGKPSIAVLPFEDLSLNKDQEPFCDGLSEALIGALSKLSNLQVRGKTSSFFFKGKEQNIQTIGDKLAVQYLLQGSLQKAGNKVRVRASLIDVSDDSVLWSEYYDGNLEDTFAFQNEIALAVVDELRIGLHVGERRALTDHPTDNIEALEIEPLSTAAMGTLAGLYDLMGLDERAEEIREKRYEISPPSKEDRNPIEVADENMAKYGRNPRFIFHQGNYYARSGNVTEAEKKIGELKNLHDSNKVDTSALYIASIYNTLGRKDEALDWLVKACENEDGQLLSIVTDDWMESVRSNPRFRAILVKLKLDKYFDFED